MTDKLKKGYLQWRCRRGTKELDVVLTTFLDNCYEALSDKDLLEFNELLNTQDTLLWYWLSGQNLDGSESFSRILNKINAQR